MDDSLQSVFKPPVDPSDEPREARTSFRLTSSNQWYLVFVAACYALAEAWRSVNSVSLGAPFVVGQIIFSGLFSAFIGWIAFRLGGRSVLVGSVAFNGVLTLCFFGQMIAFMNLKPAGRSETTDAHAMSEDEVRERLTEIVLKHGREMSEVTEEWKSSWNRMIADINFNYTIKPDDAELKRRRGHFAAHVRVVTKVLGFNDEAVPLMHRRCADLPRTAEVVNALEGVAAQHKLYMVKFKPLWDDHLKAAEALVSMTDILIENPGAWRVSNEVIVFDDGPLRKRYDDLAQVFSQALERAEERAARFRESL